MSARKPPDVAGIVRRLELDPSLPAGGGERFVGYGVMAAPFRSGDVLAMRRFPATSLGHGYTSVWHRSPQGEWTFWSDCPPLEACPRYFGSAITHAIVAPVHARWPAGDRLEIEVPDARLRWSLDLEATASTRLMNAIGRLVPDRLWRSPAVLAAMARIGAPLLHAGRLGLAGRTPNGQEFTANPRIVFAIRTSSASLAGRDLGPLERLPEQVRLGDFWIPQCALFAVGGASFEPAERLGHPLVAEMAAHPA